MSTWYRGLVRGGIAAVGQLQLLQPFMGLGWPLLLHERQLDDAGARYGRGKEVRPLAEPARGPAWSLSHCSTVPSLGCCSLRESAGRQFDVEHLPQPASGDVLVDKGQAGQGPAR